MRGVPARILAPSVPAGPTTPVLALLPGAGGYNKDAGLPLSCAPVPCWHAVFNIEGKAKARTPRCTPVLLRHLRCVCARQKIILVGFSRVGAWVIDRAQEHSEFFDAAISLAGYPWTLEPFTSRHEACVRNFTQTGPASRDFLGPRFHARDSQPSESPNNPISPNLLPTPTKEIRHVIETVVYFQGITAVIGPDNMESSWGHHGVIMGSFGGGDPSLCRHPSNAT